MTEMTTFTARELLTLLLDDLDALIDDSEGVAGLHLNGDIACWESLRQGGRFETWLMRMDEARAFLAQPEPEGPSDGEILSLMVKHNVAYLRDSKYDGPRYLRSRTEERQVFEVVRESLALYASPTIEPVPVAERLPRPEDCCGNPRNGRGRWCWGLVLPQTDAGTPVVWRLMLVECLIDEATHWLPHHALPVPGAEVG
jgi:hypothetical protein